MQQDKFWGPSLVKHRVKVGHLKNFDIDPFWLGPDRPILHGGTFDTNILMHKTEYVKSARLAGSGRNFTCPLDILSGERKLSNMSGTEITFGWTFQKCF